MTAPSPQVPGAKVITTPTGAEYVELIAGGPLKDVAKLQTIFDTLSITPQLIAAAGASQGNATAITSKNVIVVTVTASTEGIKLPVAVTGIEVTVANGAAHGVKIYPNTNGKIGAASTNAADTVLAINKENKYKAVNTTFWVVLRGS